MTRELGKKEEARKRLKTLVNNFRSNSVDYLDARYNETQARTEFITPLLEVFGWDVLNNSGQPLAYREVIEEATVEVGEERQSKRPDYVLRLAKQRKLFVEAKKPSVRLDRDKGPAFQTRRYGYSASLPISVATNFHQLVIYDCTSVPVETDQAHVARTHLFSYEEYEERFDEIWGLISRECVLTGDFDRRFSVGSTRHGAQQFDDFFLEQVRDWRVRLASDMYTNTKSLSSEELTYAVQLFLSRIVFLRICEDREIEKYETLRNLDGAATFEAFLDLLRRADDFYDSGLFRLIDDAPLGIKISDGVLRDIISELYYPHSPYTFSVVEAEVLGEIYEQFLGEVIYVEDNVVKIFYKSEVRESGGVVPTPGFVADAIVARTVEPLIRDKSPDELAGFTVADTCCGSGIFLLSAYSFLLGHYLDWYVADDVTRHSGRTIYQVGENIWRLTFIEKRRILKAHIRGVDIDANAVEVAQFSLLLKLIEDESAIGLEEYVSSAKNPALPALDTTILSGNSLVSSAEWDIAMEPMSSVLRQVVNPFNWQDEFSSEMNGGGFDAIVGNPPYIRIQNMKTYSPDEVKFYQDDHSPYATARQDNFDKYALFVERSLALVKKSGRVGVIIPNKFLTITSGRALRKLLIAEPILEEVINFGVKQVFGSASNYTCILIVDRKGVEQLQVEQAGPLEEWRYGRKGLVSHVPSTELTEEPWNLSQNDVRVLFARLRNSFGSTLAQLSNIEVGVQTSADKVYLVDEIDSDGDTITIRINGAEWKIEKDILRPCLKDVQLESFGRPKANSWMIFPYEIVTTPAGKDRARLYQPEEMQRLFPYCWKYLKAFRDELEKRNVIGGVSSERQWYQFGRSQSLIKFDQPKIILPVLSKEARYAYDDSNTVITGGGNGPYYMVRAKKASPVSTTYLLGVLNHPVYEAMIRTNTSVFRGGYYSHGKQFIDSLPIPIPDDTEVISKIEALTNSVLDAKQQLEDVRTPRDRMRRERNFNDAHLRLEEAVSSLLVLSTSDQSIIESVAIPS